MAQPSTEYDNPLTRMITRAKERNMGEARREVPVNAGASPSSRSAAVGREVPAETPLSFAEIEERNQKLRDLGVAVPGEEPNDSSYGTLADAMAAGAPVEREQSAVIDFAAHGRAAERLVAGVRLPDFTKVGGIDLIRDVVYVDSMEFPVSKKDADEFRLYCIKIAHAVVTQKLNEAVIALSATVMEAPGVGDEKVLDVPAGEAAE